MKLRFSLVSFSFGLHQQMPFLKLYYRWCLLFASPLQDKWNRSFCQDLKEIRMNDFQRKIIILSKTQICNSHFEVHIIQKKLIKLPSFQMQSCSFELKVKILVANLTTEKWSICVLFSFSSNLQCITICIEKFSHSWTGAGERAGINICSVNTQCATVGFVTRPTLEGGLKGFNPPPLPSPPLQ